MTNANALPIQERLTLRATTEAMANRAEVDFGLWNEHLNAALEAADRIDALEAAIVEAHDCMESGCDADAWAILREARAALVPQTDHKPL